MAGPEHHPSVPRYLKSARQYLHTEIYANAVGEEETELSARIWATD